VSALLDRLSAPVLAYAARLPTVAEAAPPLAAHGRVLLDRFRTDAQRAGLEPQAVVAARGALALLLLESGSSNRFLSGWEDAARGFDAMEPAMLEQALARGGPALDPVRGLVDECLDRVEAQRRAFSQIRPPGWGGMLAVLASAWLAAALCWAFWVEHRQGSALEQIFQAEALASGLDRAVAFPDLGARLDRLAGAADRLSEGVEQIRLRPLAALTGGDPSRRAAETLEAARSLHLPGNLAQGINRALASEGEPGLAYDTVRAWAVLTGAMDWQPSWLAGWANDRAALDPHLAGLAPHLLALTRRPGTSLPEADPELLAQARQLAAEASEADRAFLELRRSAAAAALPDWQPSTALPVLPEIAERRSGRDLATPIAGLYTAEGWNMAQRDGAEQAVEAARQAALRLLDAPLPAQADSKDRVLSLLQLATLEQWESWLSDLRLRSFDDRRRAVLVSGLLSRPDSPLAALISEVWHQVGGTDRQRPFALQQQVAVRFGPEIQYVETGRIDRIAELFAELNVALGLMDRDAIDAQRRLLSVQGQARSVRVLRSAPPMIGHLVEDTLAESRAAETSNLTNPLTKTWQNEVLPLCGPALSGRFPFATGPDADPAAVAALLGPGGAIQRFVGLNAGDMLLRDSDPWRWKPEARFEGLSPDSAAFLQRAMAAGPALAEGRRIGASALALRGRASMSLGGEGGELGAAGDELALQWPGAEPARGIQVSFTGPGGNAVLEQPGQWGLLRLLAPLRLREREGGQRFLIDMRKDGARMFVELRFDSPTNPLSALRLISGLTCPQVL